MSQSIPSRCFFKSKLFLEKNFRTRILPYYGATIACSTVFFSVHMGYTQYIKDMKYSECMLDHATNYLLGSFMGIYKGAMYGIFSPALVPALCFVYVHKNFIANASPEKTTTNTDKASDTLVNFPK